MPEVTQAMLDSVKEKIEKIFDNEMVVTDFTKDTVPSIDDLPDKNKGLILSKCSILFVDIRSSTQLSDKTQANNMAKIYRGFARAMSECIYLSGGQVRQIAGDRVMGVFVDDADNSSATKALMASRAIVTVIEFVFNPLCKKYINNKTIECGIGIDTGRVLTTSIGMRYKGEDSRDLVWAGKVANTASKHTDLAEAKEIFATKRFYNYLTSKYKKNDKGEKIWSEAIRIKGNTTFEGFSIHNYYLDFIDKEVLDEKDKKSESTFDSTLFTHIFDGLTKETDRYLKSLESIVEREQKLIEKEQMLNNKELKLNAREEEITMKEIEVSQMKSSNLLELELLKSKEIYKVKVDYFRNYHKDFYTEHFLKLIKEIEDIGGSLDKSKLESRNDVNYYSIVSFLRGKNEFELAYQYMIEQFQGKIEGFNFPIVSDIGATVRTLNREKQYIEALSNHMKTFSPSRKILKEFWEAITVLEYTNKISTSDREYILSRIIST